MNARNKYNANRSILELIKSESKTGSKKNLFVYHKINCFVHEYAKFLVFLYLIDNGYDVYVECKFKKGRADILAIKDGNATCYEILNTETVEELAQKEYPFEIVAFKAKDIIESDGWKNEIPI